ncbi:MAG: 1-phosphofructokinase family hexose kinase [Firmicutes bacterium]|nr:1-phosphofructokinase family hexose kinase [Bacillota bacterium]
MILTVTVNASLDKTYSVPGFAPGRDVKARRVVLSPGGKGLNVACVARALGADVMASGVVAGHTGRHILDLLDRRGVRSDFVFGRGESRSCHIIVEPSTGVLSQIREPGPRLGPAVRRALVDKLRHLAGPDRIVVCSGSVPGGLGSDVYRELVTVARTAGSRVILDASGEALALGLEAGPELIKPNQEELADLAARLRLPEPPKASGADGEEVRRWAGRVSEAVRRRYPVAVVVASLGSAGAVVAAPGGLWAAVPPPVDAVNTVSCGDALVAGIATGWQRSWPLADSVRLGVAAAAAKATRFETGRVDPGLVEHLRSMIEWRPVFL